MLFKEPKVLDRYESGAAGVALLEDGSFFYLWNGQRIRHAHSKAACTDGRTVGTRTARYKGTEASTETYELGGCLKLISRFHENFLILLRHICLYESGEISVRLELRESGDARSTAVIWHP